MADHFKEDVVISRKPMLSNILYTMCFVFMILTALYGLMLVQVLMFAFDVMALVLVVLSLGAAVLMYMVKDNFKVEYEYAFTNGYLDFAKVLRASKRKELGSMKVANLSACGHVAHDSFRRFLSMKDVEKKNWFLNRDGNLFYLYYVKDGKKKMIIIEPSEEMVEMIRHYLPVGVYQG